MPKSFEEFGSARADSIDWLIDALEMTRDITGMA